MTYEKISALGLTTLFLLVINATCQKTPIKVNISSDDVLTQIVNGKQTDISSVPWQAALRGRKSPYSFCGATIIDRFYVLTAAHCLFKKSARGNWVPLDAANLIVVVGADNLQTSPGLIEAPVVAYTTHPQYQRDDSLYDIAIIKTSIDLTRGNRVFKPQAIRLADKSDVSVNQPALISGFGLRKYNDPSPSLGLYSAVIKVVSDSECQKAFNFWIIIKKYISDKMLCAGDIDRHYWFADACNGDSGGPLVVTSPRGDKVLAGVTSYGKRCGEGSPGVYTKVSYFKKWVEEVIGKILP